MLCTAGLSIACLESRTVQVPILFLFHIVLSVSADWPYLVTAGAVEQRNRCLSPFITCYLRRRD